MSVYLIDYENVNFAGLEGVGNLTPQDEVILFYSNASSTIPMNLHIDVQKSGARMRYIRIERTGKNYLDFQLSALSGYLVGTTDQTDFVVISRDTGFDSVLDLWNKQDFVGRTLTFRRQDSIGGNIPIKPRRKRGRKTAAKTETAGGTKAADAAETPASAMNTPSSSKKKTSSGKAKSPAKEKATSPKAGSSAKEIASVEKESSAEGGELQEDFSRDAKVRKKPSSRGKKKAAVKEASEKAAESKTRNAGSTAAAKTEIELPRTEIIAISATEKKNIRTAVKELSLKPTDYTKIYRTFEKTADKQTYNTGLIRAFKNQELGNRIYKATLPVFKARHK